MSITEIIFFSFGKSAQLPEHEAREIHLKADKHEIKIGVLVCPDNSLQQLSDQAWDNNQPYVVPIEEKHTVVSTQSRLESPPKNMFDLDILIGKVLDGTDTGPPSSLDMLDPWDLSIAKEMNMNYFFPS